MNFTIKKPANVLYLFFVCMFFSACATNPPRVVSDRSVFHSFYPKATESIYVMAAHQEMAKSLEFAAYKRKFETQFLQNGIIVVSEESPANYVAIVNYGIDDGTTTTKVGSTPIFGQTGGGYTSHTGSVYSGGGYGTYSGSSYSYPTYGIVGSSAYSYDETVYKRILTMDIYSKVNGDEPEKVYEAKISSSGSCGMLNEVIDEIIAALFLDFPGNSGSSETIQIIQEPEFSC